MHSKSLEEVLSKCKTNAETGLNDEQVKARLQTYGENKLTTQKNKPFILKVLYNFKDTMIIILCIACIISFAINISTRSSLFEPFIILFIIFANVLLGAYQEQKAEKSLDSLKRLTTKTAKVLRNGKYVEVDSKTLVVGDIVKLDEGDLVPCDMRVFLSNELKVDESTLTGESFPSVKFSYEIDKNTPLAERLNMVYNGCLVVSGNALCIVTATGMKTELGKIAQQLNSGKRQSTPLQKKVSKLSIVVSITSIILALIVLVIGILDKIALKDIFMNSISLAIATIPESMTAVITLILALGVERMADKKTIIKNLPAIETLGSASVICTDKTGTLTQNKMTAKLVCDDEGNTYEIEDEKAKEILSYASLCCNGTEEIGDPTERAILATHNDTYTKIYAKISEIPFDSERKMMTTIHKTNENDYIVVTKGAFECVVDKCKNIKYIKNLQSCNTAYASQGIRVLAVAVKKLKNLNSAKDSKNIESNLNFIGLIGVHDPPRVEVKEAIEICKEAKIMPIMITGDNPETAKAIGRELGIYNDSTYVVTNSQLAQMSNNELKEKINQISIYARATPNDKLRIVKVLQELGHVVAMTGDGVNDAPALKHADIGCVMGIAGSEVAKKNSDLILTDDNFTNIVSAVKEGRHIYANIRKVVQFLLGTNYCEAILLILGLIFLGVCPIISVQLLWINLVTDTFPALGLGLCNSEKNIMKNSPTPKNQSILNKKEAITMIIFGLGVAIVALIGYYIGYSQTNKIEVASTIAFGIIGFAQIAHSLNLVTADSIFKHKISENKNFYIMNLIGILLMCIVLFIPPIANIFGLTILAPIYYAYIFICSIAPILIMEIYKFLNKLIKKRKS